MRFDGQKMGKLQAYARPFVRSGGDSRNGTDKISRMEVVYAVDAQKGNPMLRSMPNGLADKGPLGRWDQAVFSLEERN